MTINLQNLIHLTTPQYLLISLISPFSAYLLINMAIPDFRIIPIIFSLGLGILGFNTFNQISDIEVDKIDKPLRPIVSKKISVKEAVLLTWIFFSSSLLISIFVNLSFFGLMLLYTLSALAYCNKSIYLKKYFWASSFIGTITYGLVPFLAATTISPESFNIIFLLFFASLAAIISNTKDFEDTAGEKKFGIKSLPIMIGFEKSAYLIVISEGIILITIGLLAIQNYIEFKFVYATLISLVLFLVMSYIFIREITLIKHKDIIFLETNNYEIKKIITQSHASTTSMVFGLAIQLIFAITAIFVI